MPRLAPLSEMAGGPPVATKSLVAVPPVMLPVACTLENFAAVSVVLPKSSDCRPN